MSDDSIAFEFDQALQAQIARRILREALESDHGIIVNLEVPPGLTVNSVAARAKSILYRYKNEDAEFASLMIKFAPNDTDKQIWIVKGNS